MLYFLRHARCIRLSSTFKAGFTSNASRGTKSSRGFVASSVATVLAVTGGAYFMVNKEEALCNYPLEELETDENDTRYLPGMFHGKTLFSKYGEAVIPRNQFEDRKLALYFCKGSCPDCQQMTPKVEKVCSDLPFASVDVVCISSDDNIIDQWNLVRNLKNPWFALPLRDPLTIELKKRFQTFAGSEQSEIGVRRVAGIPALYVSSDGGKTWTKPLNESSSINEIKTALS